MLSLPDNWDFKENSIKALATDGISSVRSGLKELMNKGYLIREPIREGNLIVDWQYTLIDSPRNLENLKIENLKIENLNPIKLNNNSTKNELNKNNINVCTHKHKYGEYSHVLLTDKEHKHLLDLYGDSLNEHIKILDEYIETSGKKYKNHSLVIQKWVHDEWMKRNKDKPITLDSKFYAEQNTKTDKEVQDEFNRLRAQLFGA
nr:MAG TPA: Dna polymerase B [Caudoviricetes sp.]